MQLPQTGNNPDAHYRKNGSMVVYSQNGFLCGSKNECAISTGKRMNEFHKHDDE